MKKNILITGGLGYIGSHAVVAFEEAGYHTIILDNLSNSDVGVLKGIHNILGYTPKSYIGDLGDADILTTLLREYQIDGVIHFAGLKAVGESCKDPFVYYHNNVFKSGIFFQTLEKHAIRKIIFSSSASLYSADFAPVFVESTPTKTMSPYGTTKLMIEEILRDLTIHKGWKAFSLRYLNAIGAHPSGSIGENPNGTPNNLLPFILDVARGKEKKVRIFGSDYPTKDGTCIRDYVDVNDLVEAHILAYHKLDDDIFASGHHEIVNLGSRKGQSVMDMIAHVESVIGYKLPLDILDRRSGDIAEYYTAKEKAKNFLSWEPKTAIRESIENSWKYITSQKTI